VKKYKERCVKTNLYFILNYLYTHGDGESEKKDKNVIKAVGVHDTRTTDDFL
jgi:hypothetical protein